MAIKPKLNLASFTGLAAAASKTIPDAEVNIELIDVERQVRTKIGDLTELVTSIKIDGVLEPIILLLKPDGRYRLIAGERRMRASMLAALTRIPATIKRNLNQTQIRRIQVTENNEREDLTPYDEAIGVAEDVENFGFKETLVIWNRSEAWVSKRSAVKKYCPSVLELLSTGLCGDLEVLHSLNQLLAINEREYEGLVERLRSGATVSRDEARNKVSTAKALKKNAESMSQEKGKPDSSFAGRDDSQGIGQNIKAFVTESAAEQESLGLEEVKSQILDPEATNIKTHQNALPNLNLIAEQEAIASHEETETKLNLIRMQVMERGVESRAQFNSIQTSMTTLDYDMTESEWILWTAFRDVVLPILASLGADRPAAYLRKLEAEIKDKDALSVWADLHAVTLDENISGNADRLAIPSMPKNWML